MNYFIIPQQNWLCFFFFTVLLFTIKLSHLLSKKKTRNPGIILTQTSVSFSLSFSIHLHIDIIHHQTLSFFFLNIAKIIPLVHINYHLLNNSLLTGLPSSNSLYKHCFSQNNLLKPYLITLHSAKDFQTYLIIQKIKIALLTMTHKAKR